MMRRASSPLSLWLLPLALAVVIGAVVPGYVDAMGNGGAKLVALPAALLFAFVLLLARGKLLFLIVLFRASCDVAFDTTKFGFGGTQIGVGGLVNGFAILIALMLFVEKPRLIDRKVVLPWIAFLAIAALGVVLSPDRGNALRLLLQLLSTFALFVGGWYAGRTPESFRFCVKLIVWSSVIPVAYGFYQVATGGGVDYEDAGVRYASTFSHPNILAFYLVLAITLTFYLIKHVNPRRSLGSTLLLGLYLAAMIALLGLTKTRSAWAALAALIAVYGLFFERRYLAYLVVGAIAAVFVPGIGDRIFEVAGPQAISSLTPLNSLEWRESIWSSALAWMSPVRYALGYGLQAFPYHVITFFKEANNTHYGAHNDYVQLFFELGVVGVVAYVALYATTLARLRPLFRIDRLAAFVTIALVVEYLLVSASDNLMQYLSFNWYVWFLLGAALSLARWRAAPDSADA